MLFKIADSSAYLLGTHHALPSGYTVPTLWIEVADSAHTVVIEHPLDGVPSIPLERQDGTVLSGDLDKSTYAKLEGIWKELQITVDLPSQPLWRVSLIISVNLWPRLGFDQTNGLDKQLFSRVSASGQIIETLETVDSVFERFGGISKQECIRNMRYTTDLKETESIQRAIFEAWKSEDVESLDSIAEMIRKRSPDGYRRVFLDRNRDWIPKILGHIKTSRPTLIAVGAIHLVGLQSVVHLLQRHGYKATFMPS